MTFPRLCIILLYGVSGILPLIGFTVSYVTHRKRIARERQRKQHIKAIDKEFEDRKETASTTEETLEAQLWYDQEYERKHPSGKPYSSRGGVLFADDSTARLKGQYAQLRADMIYVGLAVICGAGASIWSMLLPPTS